jgi:hypothetical protein
MADLPTRELLTALLEAQRQQAVLSARLLGWFLAVTDTLRQDAEFEKQLKMHPYFDQGPEPSVHTSGAMIRHIDELIAQLKNPAQ